MAGRVGHRWRMSGFICALPMYDWREERAQVDARWARLRERFRAAGIDAPGDLVRRNGDMPAVPGGIRDARGAVVAPDPATLPPDDLDYPTLWRHPGLLFGQTCWGPLEATDLAAHVEVVGQPDYSDVEGGAGEFYSSALVMRREDGEAVSFDPVRASATLPLDLMRGTRLAFNEPHSMSGFMALARDLEGIGESLSIFADKVRTGGHRASIVAVAGGRADIAAIDCRSWHLARRHEPAAARLRVVGWTAPRKGLPYIRSARLPAEIRLLYPRLA